MPFGGEVEHRLTNHEPAPTGDSNLFKFPPSSGFALAKTLTESFPNGCPILIIGDARRKDAVSLRLAQCQLWLSTPTRHPTDLKTRSHLALKTVSEQYPITTQDLLPSDTYDNTISMTAKEHDRLVRMGYEPLVASLFTNLDPNQRPVLDPVLAQSLGSYEPGNCLTLPLKSPFKGVVLTQDVWKHIGKANWPLFACRLSKQLLPGSILALGPDEVTQPNLGPVLEKAGFKPIRFALIGDQRPPQYRILGARGQILPIVSTAYCCELPAKQQPGEEALAFWYQRT